MDEVSAVLTQVRSLKAKHEQQRCIQLLESNIQFFVEAGTDPLPLVRELVPLLLDNARAFQRVGGGGAENFLNKARLHTNPIPQFSWTSRAEWKLLRLEVLKEQAEFHSRRGDFPNEGKTWKAYIQLADSLPVDQASKIKPNNLELTVAIAFTKAEQYQEAEAFASRALSNLEQLINKNKGLPFANLARSNAAEADLVMASYCLTMHHLGNIKAKLGDYDKAIELLTKAKVLAPKYVKEKDIRLAIAANLKACEDLQSAPNRPRKAQDLRPRPSTAELAPRSKSQLGPIPSPQALVEEILAEESKGKRKKGAKRTVTKTLPTLSQAISSPSMSNTKFMTVDLPAIQSNSSGSLVSDSSDIDVSRASKTRITIKSSRRQKGSEDSQEEGAIEERKEAILKGEGEKTAKAPEKLFERRASTRMERQLTAAAPTHDRRVSLQVPWEDKKPLPTIPEAVRPPILQTKEERLAKRPEVKTEIVVSSRQPTPPKPVPQPAAPQTQSKAHIHKEMQRLRDLEAKAAATIQTFYRKRQKRRSQQVTPDSSKSLSRIERQSEDSHDLDLVIPSKDLFPLSQESKSREETPRLPEPSKLSARFAYKSIPIRSSKKEPLSEEADFWQDRVNPFNDEEERKSLLQTPAKQSERMQEVRPAQIRRRATAKDYTELTFPPIIVRKRLNPESFPYTWTLSLHSISCNRTVTFHLECLGEGLSFADNIFCELPVEIDLEQLSDYRIMYPFAYNTIWPVVASSFENMHWEGEEYSLGGEDPSGSERNSRWLNGSVSEEDSSYDESASDRVRFALENILDKYELSVKVTGKVLGPAIAPVEETEEEVNAGIFPDLYFTDKDIFKQLVIMAAHYQEDLQDLGPAFIDINVPVNERIIERGIAKLELGFFLLVLTITSDFSKVEEGFLTDYKSFVLLELNSTHSDWREMLPISWESIDLFYRNFNYLVPLSYILRHGRLPQRAQSLLYAHLSSILRISNSSISVDFAGLRNEEEKLADDLGDDELVASSSVRPVIATDINWIEKEEAVDWDMVLPGSIYSSAFTIADYTKKLQEDEAVLILNRTTIKGGKDLLHIKLAFTQTKKLSIDAWSMRTEDSYRFVQTDEETIKFLVRICEENVVCGRLILQGTMRLERTMHGTMLVSKAKSTHEADLLRELISNRLDFLNRAIRTVHGSLCIICFYCSARGMRLEVYEYISGKVYILALSENDFEEYFRNLGFLLPGIKRMLLLRESIQVPMNQAIKEFFWPLAQSIMFERTLTGIRLVWGIEEERRKDDALRIRNIKVNAKQFRFLDKQQQSISKTLKIRSLSDNIVNRLLNFEPDGLLARSNNEFQVVLQRTKLVRGRLGLLTILRHALIEEWRVHLYFPATCRSFQSRLYDSDLYGISAEALDVAYPDPSHIVNSVRPACRAWELILSQCSFEEMRGMLFFQFDNISSPMVEVLYSSIIEKNYSAGETSGVLYAEVVIKATPETVGPFEDFPVLRDLREARTKLVLSIRAYSFSKRIWVKQNLSLDEGVRLLLREHKLDESVLIQPRILFSFAKEMSNLLFKVVKLKAKMRNMTKDMSLPDITAIARSRDETLDPMVGKDDWRNIDESLTEKEERLHLTIVHAIPVTLGGAFLNVYRDEFVIRVYRPSSGESYKKVVRRKEMRNLITEVDFLLEKGLHQSLGIRIIQLLLPRVLSKISLST